jgi:transcriptional regulator with XRE-family HTH domain
MSFSERLRRLREQKGLTWYRLAKISGVAKQALARLEQPNSNPTLATLRKLARALAVTVEELVRGEIEELKRAKKRK